MKILTVLTAFCLLIIACETNPALADDGIAKYIFMNPNSTAHIYMKFGGIITDNKTKYKGITDTNTGNPRLDVTITDTPHPMTDGSTIIDYKITASDTARGMYGIQLGNCGLNPLVVGLSENELNASLFVKNFLQALPCATYDPQRDGVEVNQSGLSLKTITITYDKSRKPLISTGNPPVDTVSTDKSNYRPGDEMTITGKVDGTGMLYLRILNPFLNPVVSKYFIPRQDGTFSQVILVKGPLWSVTGTYTIEISGTPDEIRTTIYFDSSTHSEISPNIMELHASPLSQLKSGVSVENVKCNAGLILVIKAEDEFPACVTPLTAQILGQRGWATQVGTDIVLQKPSSSARPFPICNPNPAKEKLVREKQELLSDALSAGMKQSGGFKNNTASLPWSTIGYDCIDNALEVGIPPQYFDEDSLPKYFEVIRSIVGYSIDLALSPQAYATAV